MRTKVGTTSRARHKKTLARTKGFHLGRKNLFRQAKQALLKAGSNAYRDRKVKKRTFRSSWVIILNAGARKHDLSYSQLISGLNKSGVALDRKVLAELARTEPEVFSALAQKAKTALES